MKLSPPYIRKEDRTFLDVRREASEESKVENE
jgi:hypothetical protein